MNTYLLSITDKSMDIDFSQPAKKEPTIATYRIPEEDLMNYELSDKEDEHYQPMLVDSQGKYVHIKTRGKYFSFCAPQWEKLNSNFLASFWLKNQLQGYSGQKYKGMMCAKIFISSIY